MANNLNLPSNREILVLIKQEFKELSKHYGPPVFPSETEITRKIEYLKQSIAAFNSYPEFILVQDVRACQITLSYGIPEALGYKDEMTFDKFIAITHPKHLSIFAKMTIEVIELAGRQLKGRALNSILESRYALKDINGNYKLIQQFATGLAIDQKGNILSYVNHCRILGNYTGQPFNFRALYRRKEDFKDLVELVKINTGYYASYLPFTNRQMEILKHLAYEKESLSAQQIANRLNISVATIYTYYREIKEKASHSFKLKFTSAKQVADYLKGENAL